MPLFTAQAPPIGKIQVKNKRYIQDLLIYQKAIVKNTHTQFSIFNTHVKLITTEHIFGFKYIIKIIGQPENNREQRDNVFGLGAPEPKTIKQTFGCLKFLPWLC